ncbi:recombinase family protein [Pandoraea sp.]|uniref:recombinase family protein n=1 Tax=Pandoraea sp. TaxID=1883445 RepID=UPI003457D6F7
MFSEWDPFYAGAYAYGKSGKQTTIVNGRAHKSYKHRKPFEEWDVLLKEHHEGYIDWAEFERNQKLLAANAYGKAGDVKSGRGGRALLAGLLGCARCGRRLSVAYIGRTPQPVYRCYRFDLPPKCMSFGGSRIDAAIARELMRVVEPMAIEAALQAEQMYMDTLSEQRRIIELELQQAQYEATLAERRYAACDPDNRLIAAQLEKNWEAALRRAHTCQARLEEARTPAAATSAPDFTKLAEDLDAAWNAPGATMRTRQQLVRALIVDIVADVDETAREVILTIHWQGGQHSQLRIRKPKTGEHGCSTSDEALAVIRSMATRWSDQDIAASLNRMGIRTGQGKTWTAHRVNSVRRVRDIHAYKSAEKDGDWLTMSEAATVLGVTNHVIRRLIKDRILPAEQVMPDAPWQIRASDLHTEAVGAALTTRKRRPCRNDIEGQLPMFIEDSQGGAQ